RGKEIGKGGYGKVYEGQWAGTTVAIKKLSLDKQNNKTVHTFLREAAALTTLRHTNIVNFFGITTKPDYTIVMEYMAKSSLDKVLRDEPNLNWQIRFKMAYDAAVGLNYLHHQKLCHRDIKSLNIFIAEDYTAKLGDFGMIKTNRNITNTCSSKDGFVGSLKWAAPELMVAKADVKYTTACDVYSLGLVFWEITTGKHPFKNVESIWKVPMLVTQGVREKIPENVPPLYRFLIEVCWHADPSARPTVNKILEILARCRYESAAEQEKSLINYKENGLKNANATEANEPEQRLARPTVEHNENDKKVYDNVIPSIRNAPLFFMGTNSMSNVEQPVSHP
ncbi:MAG: serine/threonine kinase, partial [Gammaproteobacteria bacterium]